MTKEWEKPEDLRRRKPVLWLTMTALFMANGRCTALHRQPRRLARTWCRASRAC